MDGNRLDRLAKQRDSVLTLDDSAALGLSRDALAQHARRQRWARPYPGVLLVPGTVVTYLRAVLIAVAAAGGRRVLVCGRTAAYLWGLVDRPPRVIDLLVPADRHDPQLDRLDLAVEEGGKTFTVTVRVRRSRTVTRADAANLGGVPVTSPARTVIDLAAVLNVDDLRSLVIDARQRKVLTLDGLATLHRRSPRYRGRPKVRRNLADLAAQDCDSRLEWDFRRDAGARGFAPHQCRSRSAAVTAS